MSNKLELRWYGKEEKISVEPRILIENKELSNTEQDKNTENILIHGDNLLALKALERKYAGTIKCIYIDPPYNTGSAFEHYDDNLEHSTWLSLMSPRLQILRKLLREDGLIWIQIDDEEQAYLKVLCDEIFGRRNFLTTICVKMSHLSGVKMSHVNQSIPKLKEFVLVYAFEKQNINLNRVYEKANWFDVFDRYNQFLHRDKDNPNDFSLWNVSPLRQVAIENGIDTNDEKAFEQFCLENAENIFRTARNRSELFTNLPKDDVFREVVTATGMKKIAYKREEVLFTVDRCMEIDGVKVPVKPLGDIWEDIGINNLHNEGFVDFRNGKKPEKLIERIILYSTNPGDLVLDSFLGSGTTAAVAHKMNRRWIGIEMGNHAYTHCKVRLDNVIDGSDQGGITKSADWKGGGGYRFYELAPTLINEDAFGEPVINKEYSPEMLASAVALHEGYTYDPSNELFWKQSRGNEKSFLFVTTRFIDQDYVARIKETMQDDEFLVIACKAYEAVCEYQFKNIKIKKIPNMLLSKCEFGKEDYNLNIVHPPVYEENEDDGIDEDDEKKGSNGNDISDEGEYDE